MTFDEIKQWIDRDDIAVTPMMRQMVRFLIAECDALNSDLDKTMPIYEAFAKMELNDNNIDTPGLAEVFDAYLEAKMHFSERFEKCKKASNP